VDLTPQPNSGWYDYQTWALEPLVVPDRMPEAARLRFSATYQKQLAELFKSVVALTRETHVKQLHTARIGMVAPELIDVPMTIRPELTVEPLLTYYERRAHAYDFVKGVLESLVPLGSMRRITPDGPSKLSLDEELDVMTTAFRDAVAIGRHELGVEPATPAQRARFGAWARQHDGQDIRMMVPVFFDLGRDQWKVWAVLGWKTRTLNVTFETRPEVHIVKGKPKLEFGAQWVSVAYPVFVETYVARLLNRDEFRAHCDRFRTQSAILENL
jgi:hypothetical protein